MMNIEEKLYEIPASAEAAFDSEESALLTDADTKLAEIPEVSPAEMVEYRIRKIKMIEAQLAALEARYKPIIAEMEADMRFLAQKLDWHTRAVQSVLPPGEGNEYCGEAGSVFYSKSERTKIVDPESVPIEFCKVEASPVIRLIDSALDCGKEVPGAVRVTSWNIRIGAGGERGKANAKAREKKRLKETQSKLGF